MDKRVVITGCGVITPIGTGVNNFWNNCLQGKSNIRKIPEHWYEYSTFTSGIYSDLPEQDFSKSPLINKIEQKQLDQSSLMTLCATGEALDNASLSYTQTDKKANKYSITNLDTEKTGVLFGTGIGGISTVNKCFSHQILTTQEKKITELITTLHQDDSERRKIIDELVDIKNLMQRPMRFNPFAVSMIMPNSVSANIAIKFNITGSNNTFCSACASGTTAIGNAYEYIKNGRLTTAITGGVEYLDDDYGALFKAFDNIKALVKNNENPEIANRPFDMVRSGFLFSKGGAAVLILEELAHAEKRNAPIIAEITGYAENSDGYNIMLIDRNDRHLTRLIGTVLKKANMKAHDIDYINAHGTGTQLNDDVESALIEKLFGNQVPVNSTKSILGHTLGASGAIEAVVCAYSIKHKTTHISKNITHPVRNLNFVRAVDEYPINTALSQSFGFGAHNAALIFKKYDE